MTTRHDMTQAYRRALRSYLAGGRQMSSAAAHRLGSQALASGFTTLDLALLHERVLVASLLPACQAGARPALIRRAAAFFGMAMDPIERMSHSQRLTVARLKRSVRALGQRTVELAASNQELSQEITRRTAVAEELRGSERRYRQLLTQSDRQQNQLRHLSRQILLAQEDERKNISRELHDVIAQTLTGINLRLSALKSKAMLNARDLDRTITRTQQLVVKSVDIIHQFARELRPAVLDDIGLIPALHAFINGIAKRSGFRVRLTASAQVEALDPTRRTVLFRIAQEALINVARHAEAGRVEVAITRSAGGLTMAIHDDGRSFEVDRVLATTSRRHLGLIGMRERLEMVGGTFAVASTPGRGTTVTAFIPLGKRARGRPLPSTHRSSETHPGADP